MLQYTIAKKDCNMKTVTKDILKASANKLMFDMSDEQYDTLLAEFDTFLKQLELLNEVPHIDEVEPMTFTFDVSTSYLREDVAEEPLKQEEAVKNSGDVKNGQIRLPKVVG